MSEEETIHFYQQLSLLVQSNLPLPESLRQLAAACRSQRARQTLRNLAGQTRRGDSLAAAMRAHGKIFPPLHVELIGMGERDGFLSDVLAQLAHHSRQKRDFIQRLRGAMLCAAFTCYMALAILSGILVYIVPSFASMFDELLAGMELPGLTHLVIWLSNLAVRFRLPLLCLLIFLAVLAVWLFSGTRSANRWAEQILGWLPGFAYLRYLTDYARLCGLLGTYVRYRVPLGDAMRNIAATLESGPLARRVGQWTRKLGEGRVLTTAVMEDPESDPLFVTTLQHAPEAELAPALEELAEQFLQRAEFQRDHLYRMTMVITGTAMTVIVGSIILAMFTPLIKLIDTLGGA